MTLTWIDWSIVAILAAVIFGVAAYTRQFNRSVADYLAGNRTAGRYLLTIADGIAAFGAITAVANFQMYYKAGFTAAWWTIMTSPTTLIIALSGWIIYRYRQTRVLSMAQFFEIRYSRNFRVFTGIICWLSGIINYGIFPAVMARFLIYFCKLPVTYGVFGWQVSTFATIMFVNLAIALYFVLLGGHITVMVTDFVQGLFCNVVFIALVVFIFWRFDWHNITDGLSLAPADQSMINPFKTGATRDFDFWWFAIGFFGAFYTYKAWQGTAAFQTSAKSPHEARMAGILAGWRANSQWLMLLMLPIIAFVVMKHPDFAGIASAVNADLAKVPDPNGTGMLADQMRVPLALSHLLPVGLAGLFLAMMLSAAITTDDAYLHSWGSIFIQDVILPFRKRPFTPKQHILLLRLSTVGVAVFAFMFSLLYSQSMYILMFMTVTGAIFFAGAGSAIIGGLYWKRGTAGGAWAAMIVGIVISVTDVVLDQPAVWRKIPGMLAWMRDWIPGLTSLWDLNATIAGFPERLPINANWASFFAMIAAVLTYVIVSLFGRQVFNLDRMLHRGKYGDAEFQATLAAHPVSGWRALVSFGPEWTRGDKFIYFASMAWTLGWFTIFIVGTCWQLFYGTSDEGWKRFWLVNVGIGMTLAIVVTVWFLIGGLRDLREMFHSLRTMRRDDSDMGMVLRPEESQKSESALAGTAVVTVAEAAGRGAVETSS